MEIVVAGLVGAIVVETAVGRLVGCSVETTVGGLAGSGVETAVMSHFKLKSSGPSYATTIM